jgi:hypothetical protein
MPGSFHMHDGWHRMLGVAHAGTALPVVTPVIGAANSASTTAFARYPSS